MPNEITPAKVSQKSAVVVQEANNTFQLHSVSRLLSLAQERIRQNCTAIASNALFWGERCNAAVSSRPDDIRPRPTTAVGKWSWFRAIGCHRRHMESLERWYLHTTSLSRKKYLRIPQMCMKMRHFKINKNSLLGSTALSPGPFPAGRGTPLPASHLPRRLTPSAASASWYAPN